MTRTELENLLQANFPDAWYISSTPLSDPKTPAWAGRTGSEKVNKYQVGTFAVSGDTFEERYLIALHQGDAEEDGWSINLSTANQVTEERELLAWAEGEYDHIIKFHYDRARKVASLAVRQNNSLNYVVLTSNGTGVAPNELSTSTFFQL